MNECMNERRKKGKAALVITNLTIFFIFFPLSSKGSWLWKIMEANTKKKKKNSDENNEKKIVQEQANSQHSKGYTFE